MKKIFLIICIILIFSQTAFAHQPRFIQNSFTQIENPEVSQAFYSELKGQPHFYEITSPVPFNLFVSITVPDLPDIDKDLIVQITNTEDISKLNEVLDGEIYEWTAFHEEFAGDDYFQGPELETTKVESGTYEIKVFSPDNWGKYVLVVGEKEEFPINEIINTFKTLPTIKSEIFEKPKYDAFLNIFSLFIFGPIILGILIILFIIALIKRRKYGKKEKN